MNHKPPKRLIIVLFLFTLLSACSATKPLARCTEDFTPINAEMAVKP